MCHVLSKMATPGSTSTEYEYSTETLSEVESEESADVESGSDCTSQQPIVSLLNRLRQAPKATANRKRKVALNLCHDGKRSKAPRCMGEPKSITIAQRVKEYSDEGFTVSAKKLFCTACREEVSTKKSVINLHIKSEEHSLQSKNKREQDIAMALQKYDEEVHPVGETLSAQQRVYRVKVVSSFLKARVPLSKIDHFRPSWKNLGTVWLEGDQCLT